MEGKKFFDKELKKTEENDENHFKVDQNLRKSPNPTHLLPQIAISLISHKMICINGYFYDSAVQRQIHHHQKGKKSHGVICALTLHTKISTRPKNKKESQLIYFTSLWRFPSSMISPAKDGCEPILD